MKITAPLTNLQVELLKLFSRNLKETQLLEIKQMIARYLFEQARIEADRIWDEKHYSQKDIDRWANED